MVPRPRKSAEAIDRRCSRGIDSYRCQVCTGIHPLKRCRKFLRLNVEKRLRAVIANKYCANCLAHQHSGGSCRSKDKCRLCDKDHHTLLHFHEKVTRKPSPRASPAPKNRRPCPQASTPLRSPSLTTLLQHRNPQVLPTATVVMDNGTTTYETRALIDPCEPVSRINASMARAFHLNSVQIGDEEACSAVLRSMVDKEFRLEVVLKIDPGLHMRTPSTPIDAIIKDKFDHITLADDRFFRPSTVAIILGADIYTDIIRAGVIPGTAGLPVAQSTVFGWTLSGVCRA